MEHVAKGRWRDARQPNEKELAATSVVAIPLREASAKIRTGPPKDPEADYALRIWAGVLPLSVASAAPVADTRNVPGVGEPAYITTYTRS